MSQRIEILDCTLRDGSYPINYSYTLDDTENICRILEQSGVLNIEVGHGLGLGAAEKGYGKSAFNDLEYIEAAVNAIEFSHVGVFAIPGIAEESHVVDAYKAGIKFIRVGTDVDKIAQARELIEMANSLSLNVSLNVMKSYARSKEELLSHILNLKDLKIDTISIVDSAGTMIPEEVEKYVKFLVDNVENKVGFHGHNNLQLAIANSLAAANSGASVIDATLRGIGRSSGNAQIEVLVPILNRLGYVSGVDYLPLSEFSDLFYAPPYPDYGVSGIELACGVSGFHSSFLPKVISEANSYRVDAINLIDKVASIDRVNLNLETLRNSALDLPRKNTKLFKDFSFNVTRYTNVQDYAKEISLQADKFSMASILTFSPSDSETTYISGITRQGNFIIGHIEISEFDSKFLENQDLRYIQKIGFDEKLSALNIRGNNIFLYNEDRIVSLLLSEILTNIKFKEGNVPVEVIGNKGVELLEPSINFKFNSVGSVAPVIIVSSRLRQEDELRLWNRGSTRIIFLHSRYVPANIMFSKGLEIYTLDYREFFDLNIIALARHSLDVGGSGISEMGGVMTVSGGLIAPRGTIVLDNSSNPERILGVASGFGSLLPVDASKEFEADIEIVHSMLLESRLRLIRSGD